MKGGKRSCTGYEYDAFGHMTKSISYNVEKGYASGWYEYEYDVFGNRVGWQTGLSMDMMNSEI